jgi:D-alanyl-lipoteichoic acid acyltransferase DltB (MBOAT superfamily)
VGHHPSVGISFYTFESLAYTINVYRGERASRSLLDFALFLSFFPHLVRGPIVRPRAFLPQLETPPTVRAAAVEERSHASRRVS